MWQTKKLGELCDIKTGKKDVNQGNPTGMYPFFTCARDHTYSDEYSFDTEALLVAGNGDVGHVSYYKGKFEAYQRTYVISDFKGISPRLLFLFLDGFLKDTVSKQKLGNTMPYIKMGMLTEFEVPVPPLADQKIIVKKLDEIFEKVAKAKANAEKNLQNSKELFESYLQSVFAKPGKDWEEKKLGSLTSKIGSGATPRGGKESYIKEGISLVRSMNVHDRSFVEKNLAFIDDKQAKDLANVTLEKGDVLLNITGASITRSCVFPDKYLPARVNQHVSIIRPLSEVIDSIFLNYLLTSKLHKDRLLVIGGQGATRQAITKAQLENFSVSLPKSLVGQRAIVKKLDALSTETKKLEKIYRQKLTALEELKKSILKKAFAGEL